MQEPATKHPLFLRALGQGVTIANNFEAHAAILNDEYEIVEEG